MGSLGRRPTWCPGRRSRCPTTSTSAEIVEEAKERGRARARPPRSRCSRPPAPTRDRRAGHRRPDRRARRQGRRGRRPRGDHLHRGALRRRASAHVDWTSQARRHIDVPVLHLHGAGELRRAGRRRRGRRRSSDETPWPSRRRRRPRRTPPCWTAPPVAATSTGPVSAARRRTPTRWPSSSASSPATWRGLDRVDVRRAGRQGRGAARRLPRRPPARTPLAPRRHHPAGSVVRLDDGHLRLARRTVAATAELERSTSAATDVHLRVRPPGGVEPGCHLLLLDTDDQVLGTLPATAHEGLRRGAGRRRRPAGRLLRRAPARGRHRGGVGADPAPGQRPGRPPPRRAAPRAVRRRPTRTDGPRRGPGCAGTPTRCSRSASSTRTRRPGEQSGVKDHLPGPSRRTRWAAPSGRRSPRPTRWSPPATTSGSSAWSGRPTQPRLRDRRPGRASSTWSTSRLTYRPRTLHARRRVGAGAASGGTGSSPR